MDVLKALKGQLVVTQYNPQQYRIDDVDFEASPRKEFVKRDGGATTIEEYLGLKWGIRLTEDELNQPLLVSHNKGELVLLVPSLCIMTGLTDGMRKKMNIMKGLCTCIHMAPEERRMVLSEFIQKLSVPEVRGVIMSIKISWCKHNKLSAWDNGSADSRRTSEMAPRTR